MANWFEPTEEERASWMKWVDSRPASVKDLCLRFPAWVLYRISTTGQRVAVRGYNEDGTMTVTVSGKYNLTPLEHGVFGIKPEDLEECELPGPDEPVGVTMTHIEQRDMINAGRADNGLGPLTDEEWDSYNHGAEREGTKH